MTNSLRVMAAALAFAGLTACSSGDRVVLMPDPDGHVGRVEVATAAGARVLDQAKTGTSVANARSAPSAAEAVSEQTIDTVWGAALRAMPPRPQTTLLYFKTGTAELRPESEAELPRIAALLRAWKHPHVLVVGHADATGSEGTNIKVSRERAAMVRDMLVSMGVPARDIEVSSHGKRNPLVKTPDGVAEPRNRRVSVTIQ